MNVNIEKGEIKYTLGGFNVIIRKAFGVQNSTRTVYVNGCGIGEDETLEACMENARRYIMIRLKEYLEDHQHEIENLKKMIKEVESN